MEKTETRTVKSRTIVLLALILTGLVFLTAVLTSEMAYLTNDDGGIQSVLSGLSTGEPYPYHQFISVILSFPIAGLYSILPGIQWWYVWSLVAMAMGIFLVQYCLLRIAVRGQHSPVIIIGILIFLDIGFFLYPTANVSFTIVPAVLGTGLVAGLLWMAEKDTIRHKGWLFAGIVIGYILLLSHRRDTGLVVLCFLLLAFLYYYVSKSEKLRQAILKFSLTAIAFLLLTESLTVLNRNIQNNLNGEDFVAFNSARSQYMDYPHDSYNENPELYEEVGWDEDLYHLVNKWYFLNDNVTTENLSYLAENSEHTTASTSVISTIKDLYHDKQCFSIFLLFGMSVILAGFSLLTGFDWKNLLFLLMNNGGAGILILYQIFSGRALYRSVIIVLLPAAVINLMLGLRKEIKGRSLTVYRVCLILLELVCIAPTLSATFDQDRKTFVTETNEKEDSIRAYLADHQTEVYISETRGISDNINPWNLSRRASNRFDYGSSTRYSALYHARLEANGLSALNEETFKLDRVHFISKTNVTDPDYHDDGKDLFAMLYRKLQEDCGSVGFVYEDTITEGVYVYHFVFPENVSQYDSYYDLQDGQARIN